MWVHCERRDRIFLMGRNASQIQNEKFGRSVLVLVLQKKNLGVRRRRKKTSGGRRIWAHSHSYQNPYANACKTSNLFFYLTRNTGPGPYVLALGEVLQRLAQLSDGCIPHPPLPTDGVLHPAIASVSLISLKKNHIGQPGLQDKLPPSPTKKNTGESK